MKKSYFGCSTIMFASMAILLTWTWAFIISDSDNVSSFYVLFSIGFYVCLTILSVLIPRRIHKKLKEIQAYTYRNDSMIALLEKAKKTYNDPNEYKDFCGKWKRISINGDGDNYIWLDSSDISIPNRIIELINYVKGELVPKLNKNCIGVNNFNKLNKHQSFVINKLGNDITQRLNAVFGYNVSASVFAEVNPLSLTATGNLLIINFLEEVIPVIVGCYDKSSLYKIGKGNS